MNYNFTDRVRKVLAMAREEAIRLQHDYVGTEHILLGLIREGEGVAAAVLNNLAVDLEQVQEKVEKTVRRGKATIALGELPYTSRAKKVLEFAMAEARELNHSYVGTEHLLLGLLREEKGDRRRGAGAARRRPRGRAPRDAQAARQRAQRGAAAAAGATGAPAAHAQGREEEPRRPRSTTSAATSPSSRARASSIPTIGRAEEIERVMQILSRRKKNNPVLIGEPGVGKTAIVEGLAQRIAERQVPREPARPAGARRSTWRP